MLSLVDFSYRFPFRPLRDLVAKAAFPVAEHFEGRDICRKVREIRRYYGLTVEARRALSQKRLGAMLRFAGAAVPYYRDLFTEIGFDVEKAAADGRRLEALPVLTKQIIAEQGVRMLSRPLDSTRHYAMTTGGSTGSKITVFYDQEAADYSAAATSYARGRIGARHGRAVLHFAAALPGATEERWPNRETAKGLATNRSNIFFGALDDQTLIRIWRILRRRRPFLVHGHPSTLFAVADHVVDGHLDGTDRHRAFSVFESSGEVLSQAQRQAISQAFGCRVVDRYGLAEFGVIAYEFDQGSLEVLDSECWIEGNSGDETAPSSLIVTGLRNKLMPLIRYDTGDLAELDGLGQAERIRSVVGRVHDVVSINGVPHLTHYVQDVLDHRVGGIKDFQIDARVVPPVLRIVLENAERAEPTRNAVEGYWPGAFVIEFVGLRDLIRVGDRAKFRHVVTG